MLLCEELSKALCLAPLHATSFDLLDIVSQFHEPIAILRSTVALWRDTLQPENPLFEPSEDLLLTMYPAHLADRAQPFCRPQQLWKEEPPTFKLLGRISFCCRGLSQHFAIPSPPSPEPMFPWQAYHTLKSGIAERSGPSVLCQFARKLRVWRKAPVCIRFCKKAEDAWPVAVAWLRDLGFRFREEVCESPVVSLKS